MYGKLSIPIKRRTRVGRDLYDIFMDVLFLLAERVESENPFAVTDDFLNNLGYTAIEVKFLHQDYSIDAGWDTDGR